MFTFHSGEIKAVPGVCAVMILNMFTFHSGEIKATSSQTKPLLQSCLHSILVRLKQNGTKIFEGDVCGLHSILVRLKPSNPAVSRMDETSLHSILVRLKLLADLRSDRSSVVYIPFW